MHIILAKLTNMQIYKSNCRYNMHNIHYKHIANIPGIISQKYNMYNKPILHLSLFLSFFVQTTLSNNNNSKTVQALTLILPRNECSSQRAASQPLSVFIASNLPWSIKAIHNTLSFFVQTTLSNNNNSKTVQALTLILPRNECSSQRAASQPLSVFIASNLPWSIKAIHNTLWLLFVVKDAIF